MDTGLDLRTVSKHRQVHLSPMSSDTESSPMKEGDSSGPNNTPRKNKRKSSEPRKRSDFSIKRLCPDAPHSADTFQAEDGEGRYRENPPSTPETNNSTPSPPDNVALRIPQILAPPPRIAGPLPPGFLPHPYPLSVPLIPVPPTTALMPPHHHHMVARQQHQLPVTSSLHMPKHTNNKTATANTTTSTTTSSSHQVIPQQQTISTMKVEMDMNIRHRHVTGGKGKSRRQTVNNNSRTNTITTTPTMALNSDIGVFETPAPVDQDMDMDVPSPTNRRSRKNYKNMTRERRVEANARERSRVHTISAAFENLRHAVPSYSHNQRLSKLAILRIACTYIMSLANLAGEDYSWDKDQPSFADCVDQCTKTIQTEGRAKRRH